MARTSITGYQRQYGSNQKTSTPSVGLQCIQFTVPTTQTATATTGKTLPNGSIPLFVQNIDGASTTGTIDIGTAADDNGFTTTIDATAKSGLVDSVAGTGVLLGVTLTVDTPIFATANTVDVDTLVSVYYIMADDGSA